ncbi:BTAD domain-containing putative transcriptional regulator [Actinophytocola sp.]|uniref:BTAD domain-containing putative transcriptional regulator n=1 Tax=Actinophytocola sp. TaxID=1872138 RepID=UPI002ED87837
MQFGVLGPLEVRTATGEPVVVGGPRPRALLVLLLLNAGRTVGLEQLIAGQYDDDPPAGAANAVQVQVSRLRKAVPGIEFTGAGYRLAVDPGDVDALRFERLARDGHRSLAAGDHARAAATLREALGLWRGPALPDLPHGAAMATRLDDLRLDATEDLVEAELALPEGTDVAELRRLTKEHPLRERLRGHLMRALHAGGRPAEALAEFEDVRRLLADDLGTDPSPELAAVHLAILRADQAPARRGPAAQLTSFVGRGAELARLASLRDTRLVTILGPGGIGKTRLAVESAREDACFADLSPVDDPDTVPHAVLAALGVREAGLQAPATDPTRRLAAALGREELRLILDNCEHVVAAVAALARTLLAECPGLRIVATSREPLGLTGETLVPLAPLDDAVRLFADRAAAVRPGWTVTPDNLATVTDLCARLDGLPLAIELAAARLRQFTVDELAARLAEHGPFRLLSRGDRTAAARHRTLRAVVAWSWDLLSAEEQTVARRFSVFTGAVPLAAAEAVCGTTDDVLADLVDRSLIDTDGTRYRMLETIRLFCAERLAESGEPVRARHAAHYLDLALRADPHLRRAEQLEWLAELSVAHDNLMAALRWAVRQDRVTALRLVAALAAYWWLSGRRSQAGEAAAALLTEEVPEGLEEEYVSCVVHAVPRAAPEHWARAHQIMRPRDGELRYPFTAALFGMAVGPWGPPADAEPLLGTDPWNVALGRLGNGLRAVLGGRTAEGEQELREVLAAFRGLGERWGTAQALDWLAEVAGWRGEWGRAHELWAEALELYERLGALEECVDVLCRRAGCAVRQATLDAAAADYRRAAVLSARAGRPDPPAVRLGLAEVARLRGHPDEARALLGTASATEGDLGAEVTRARIRTALGRLAEAGGDPAEARRQHREAVDAARASPMRAELAGAVEGLAGTALPADPERAALLLGAAVALRGTALTGDPDVARVAATASDLLGPDAFAAAYARGAAMPPDRALTTLDGG